MAAKTQADPSFADCPQLVLSAIHDFLLHGSDDAEGFCRQPVTKDAACFRATCKAFSDAAGPLPSTLKLSFDDPPSQQATQSLAFMLSRPIAAHTQLSLRLCMQHSSLPVSGPPSSSSLVPQIFGEEFDQPWAPPLAALAQRVACLEMPSLFLFTTVSAVCKAMPGLGELVLHIGSHTETGYILAFYDSTKGIDIDASYEACYSQSQLQSLTLSVPSGQSPFHFVEDEPLLILYDLPILRTLVLRGPIVQEGFKELDGMPFLLKPGTKVVIDPGLGSRRPTQWARPLTVYDRFDAMPGSAIPDALEYCEEDGAARQTNLDNFRQKVKVLTCKQDSRDQFELYFYTMFTFLDDEYMRGMMSLADIEARSDLLERFFSAEAIAKK